jgi:hypothetical protein
MNVKDKAEELVNLFAKYEPTKMGDYTRVSWASARNFAIIVIDRLLKDSKMHGFIGLTEEYEQIKQEIENL